MPTSLSVDKLKGATKVGGSFKAVNSKLKKSYDEIFQMEVGYYENEATFVQRFKVTDKAAFLLEGDLRSQVCSEVDGQCIPIKIDFNYTSKDLPATLTVAAANATEQPVEEKPVEQATEPIPSDSLTQTVTNTSSGNTDLWTPVIKELRDYGAEGDTSDLSLLWIFIVGMGGGAL